MSKLDKLVEEARRRKEMTPAERKEQRISFAYGNAAEDDSGSTVESVKAAAKAIEVAKAS